jgi:dCTP deaminase
MPIRFRLFLSRPDLIKEIKSGRLKFDPPIEERSIDQVSIDLRLGPGFARFNETLPKYISSVFLDESIWEADDIWELIPGDNFLLKPKCFVLGQTLEKVTIPNHLFGLIEGRSRYARLGLTTHLTAPKIDPGFYGHITLEIANLGSLPIMLRAGTDKIAQLMLARVTTPLTKKNAYGSDSADIFQGQVTPIPKRKRK